ALGNGLAGVADDSLELRLDSLVASLSLLVGLVALDLRLDVCHAWKLPFSDGWDMSRAEEGCCSTFVRDKPTRKPRTNSIRSRLGSSRAARTVSLDTACWR